MKITPHSLIRPTTCLVGAVLMTVMITLGCNHQDKQSGKISRPVKVVRIGDEAAAGVMSFAGEVRARYETTLAFRVSGKMIHRLVEVGDRVRKGQRLARLDSNDFQLGVDALHAQLKSAQAEQDFTRDNLTRYRELLNLRVISPAEFDRHETAYVAARERVAALTAQLSQATNQLRYSDLLADRDGVVTALEAEAGQVVAAGQPIVKLARLDEKEIHFDIPEQRASEIELRQNVHVTLWTGGDRQITARIREIAAAADPASRTYRVKATLLEGQNDAQLGKTATVWIPLTIPSRIVVPLSAVFTSQNEPGRPRVWLVDEQTGTVGSVPVQLGETLDGERIVVEGVRPGQLVVSAGVQRLVEGQAVRVPEQVVAAMQDSMAGRKEDRP
ncbi:MAG: efflux RND transporter periplasmic adaptor subunit [Nitrospira sp.]|nr:efflux RND transporter periplasmic adaptor subunit [Nitrospira sp.]MCP9460798.1 efflux RND transporter periplasmic adaptor subunit [Nitrospira sp.]MCP9475013.1 efflux RND transporter periplasmic adaptor subunit [Nitrospira sp.]